ncbi:hypothetical protein GCM10009753_28730 [Streptantibioticus ferralitis]
MAHLEGSVCWALAELAETGGAGGEAEQEVGERFVTAALLDIPDDRPEVLVISCGHPTPPLLPDGRVPPLNVPYPAPPLGLGDLSAAEYDVVTFAFVQGDLLLLYTDGVTGARNRDGVFYPLASRVTGWTKCEPEQLLSHITDDLRAYVAGPLDDAAAAIAVRRTRPAEPGGDLPVRR